MLAIKTQRVRLEASTACQLRCPSCPTASGAIGRTLGTGMLSAESFEAFLSQNPGITEVELSNWGEIFLNPQLEEIMKIAFERNVALAAKNGANLNSVAPSVLEALVKYKFRAITCSIDGASQEVYSQYRVRGDFDQVIENIKTINKFKAQYNSEYPKLIWQFVMFGHNLHEVEKARALSRELKMDFGAKLDWGDLYFEPKKDLAADPKAVQEITKMDFGSRKEFEEQHGTTYRQKLVCHQLWREPQINFDGRVLGCCVNHWGDFGNAFQTPLDDCINSEKMEYARKMLMGKKAARDDIPCSTCSHYQGMKKHKDWMSWLDLKLIDLFFNDPKTRKYLRKFFRSLFG